jgi:hypothetical protein
LDIKLGLYITCPTCIRGICILKKLSYCKVLFFAPKKCGNPGHVACMVEKRTAYKIFFLVGKPERKKPLRRKRHRLEDSIKMDFKEMGWWTGIGWIDLAQDRDKW